MESDLHDILTSNNYLYDIAVMMRDYCRGRKTVIFLPLVKTAKEMADLLNDVGSDIDFHAISIDGKDPQREEKLEDFQNGKYNIICCSTLLTEGWDCPSVDCVVVLRPTRSQLLYQQMVGRGTRICKGKTELLLLDFLWLSAKYDICGPASLLNGTGENDEEINQKIRESANGMDLFDAESEVINAKEAREESLEAEIDENRYRQKEEVWLTDENMVLDTSGLEIPEKDKYGKRKLLALEEYVSLMGSKELEKDLVSHRVDRRSPTQKQVNALQSFGVSAHGVTKAQASDVIGFAKDRVSSGCTTVWQIKKLQEMGFTNVSKWRFKEAKDMISLAQNNRWRIPKGINPPTYVPQSIKAWEGISDLEF